MDLDILGQLGIHELWSSLELLVKGIKIRCPVLSASNTASKEDCNAFVGAICSNTVDKILFDKLTIKLNDVDIDTLLECVQCVFNVVPAVFAVNFVE